MTTVDFVKELARKSNYSQKTIHEVFMAAEELAHDWIVEGKEFKLMDVNYLIKDVEDRTARNPKTGEAVDVPAHKKVALKMSKTLKNTLK